MATFSALKTRVKDYLIDVPTKTDALVGAWINKAIGDAEKKHDFHHMKATLSQTTTVGNATLIAKPSDWKSIRGVPFRLYDDGSYDEMGVISTEIDYKRQFLSTETADRGEPRQIFINTRTDTIELLPIPDDQGDFSDNYTIILDYWAYTAALANNNDTNWFTNNAEWYVTYQAAAEGMLFNRDHGEAQIAFELARIQLGIDEKADDKQDVKTPRMLVPRAGVYGKSRGLPPRS